MSTYENATLAETEIKTNGEKQVEFIDALGLTTSHKDYLLSRHGTLELDPMPAQDPADPLNWPRWKASPPKLAADLHEANSRM